MSANDTQNSTQDIDIQAQVELMNEAGRNWKDQVLTPKLESTTSDIRRTNYYHVHMKPPTASHSGADIRNESKLSNSNMNESMAAQWQREGQLEHTMIMTYMGSPIHSPYA